MSNFFENLMKTAESQHGSKVSDGNEADVDSFIDTGSYSLNAVLSGSIYGGLPANKITAFAGDESTGKTFYALNIVAKFLSDNPDGAVFYFESESAITTDQLVQRGIDTKRFFLMPVVTIQEFRTQVLKIINSYLEENEKNRKPMFMVLDSLGSLSTEKEVTDIADGKDTRDMTRAQLVRGTFRVLTLKLGRAKVALLVTNHTYAVIGAYMPTKDMGGGSGLKYAATAIVYLSKSKKRSTDKTEVVGAIITAKMNKSRLTMENKEIETLLDYQTGLNKYYGLLDLAAKHGLIEHIAKKYKFPNGENAFENAIYKNPEKFFTQDLLDKIDEAAKKEFKYGTANTMDSEEAE